MRLVPKNWVNFQHYKDRSPPWVKLHKTLLEDRNFSSLPIASKALAPMLWLLASESKDGIFDASMEELAFRLRWSEKDISSGLKPLINKGFFIVESKTLAECEQVAVPETEERESREDAITEKASKKKIKTSIPENFGISESVREWAREKGHDQLEIHLENFIDSCKAKNYEYIDWDSAFRKAITGNWAKVNKRATTVIETRTTQNGMEWKHPVAGWVANSNVPMPNQVAA